MPLGETRLLPGAPDVLAPDGSEVRLLLARAGGSMAHFRLSASQVARAVRHRGVEEIWYILAGAGTMWQADANGETEIDLVPGLCLTIPAGTSFQFRAADTNDLAAVAITMPPWPGPEEAEFVVGRWPPSL